MHKTPADVDDRDEREFVARIKARAVHTQEWWDIEVDRRTQGLRPNDQNQKDAFKKEAKSFLPRPVYTLPKRDTGPSLYLTDNTTGQRIDQHLLPYNVSWR